jgi:galactokinase/dTDP-glucose pyrophosphorylase
MTQDGLEEFGIYKLASPVTRHSPPVTRHPTPVLFSPYRLCPIGAHIDHQGGVTLGRTIQLGTTLEYESSNTNEIRIVSEQFGETKFVIGELDTQHWSRYAQAAARVLNVQRGMRAHLTGSLVGAGLSSSASVGLAYLRALADVNGIDVSNEELVQFDFRLEHDELGLQNGLLDPMTIIYGKRNSLLFMDTKTGSVSPIVDPLPSRFAWVVAYSGISRELTKSGFNARVAECCQAAAELLPSAQILSDVPREVFEDRKSTLPENLRKRAEHYFTEVERVHVGAQAWQDGDLSKFGQLMNESCHSSIHNYQSGSDVLIDLHEIVSSTNGVYGSRFSGGGYGGCVVALAEKDKAQTVCAEIQARFKTKHPDLESKVFIVETADGLAARHSTPATPHPSPKSAILLAAGRGKRQRPYTDVTPKPLLEVHGRPILDYVLRAVKQAGVERICIVTNHLEEKIFEYVGGGSKWNLAVTFAHQTELNGTCGALQAVPQTWIQDEAVMVVATDYILEEESLCELVEAHQRRNADITMSLKECPIEELSARSSVDVDSDWRVKRIIEKPKREEMMSPYAASILFIFPPEIWSYLKQVTPSERDEIELQSAVDKMIQDGYQAFGLLQKAPEEWSVEKHLTADDRPQTAQGMVSSRRSAVEG